MVMKQPRTFDLALSPTIIEPAVRAALNEDLGLAGDVTTNSVIGPDVMAKGLFATRKPEDTAPVT